MSLDKKLNKIFNQEASLENEDWLTLDDDFYSNIENQIIEKPKKKKRFLYILLGIGILLFVVFLFIYLLDSSTNVLGQNTEIISTSQKTSMSNDNINHKNVNALLNYSIPSGIDTIENLQTIDKNILAQKEKSTSIEIQKKNVTYTKQVNKFSDHFINKKESYTPSKDRKTQNYDQVPQSYLKEKDLNAERSMSFVIYPDQYIKSSKIDTLKNNIDSKQIRINTTNPPIDKSWYWKVSTGYAYGKIKHNNEYKLAVEPAAYRNSNYSSSEIDFTIAKSFNSNLALYTKMGFGISTFTSGHNANLYYSLDDEVDMTNAIDINMATPLGFVSSEILITRENTGISGGLIEIDLHNQHNLKELFFELGLEYTWIKRNYFSFSTIGGIGNRYTVDVNNSLAKIDFPQIGYRYQSKVDKSIPKYLNRYRWYSSIGISTNYLINNNSKIEILTAYRYQFNNLYQQDAFNVRMSNIRFSIGYSKTF